MVRASSHLRVCFVTGFRPTSGGGGTEKHVYELAKGLRERGVDVDIICEDRSFLPDQENDLDDSIIGVHPASLREKGWVERYHEKSRRFEELIRPDRYDVVHCHSHYGFHTALQLASQESRPALVSTFHLTPTGGLLRLRALGFDEPAGAPIDRAVAIMEETLARLSDRCIAVSAGVRDELIDLYGLPGDDVDLIYNWCDKRIFRPHHPAVARERLGLDPEQTYLLYVGHFHDFRGKMLAEALRYLDRDATVLAIHPNIDDTPVAHLGNRVRFVGYQPPQRLALYYAAADVQCFPTVYGGFGLVLVEGMACGCPPVVFDFPAMNEIVTPGCGYLAEEPTAEAYAAAITRGLDDGDTKRTGAVRRAQHFDMSTQIDHVLDLYREVLVHHRGSAGLLADVPDRGSLATASRR